MPTSTQSATRRCSRCLLEFPLEPDAEHRAAEWWLCGPCHAVLLPNRPS